MSREKFFSALTLALKDKSRMKMFVKRNSLLQQAVNWGTTTINITALSIMTFRIKGFLQHSV
jgi:hypothetical protein